MQQKWCTLVEHIAHESLATDVLARQVTIVLAAPPGDGLRSAREHFTEYIKPVLVAGSLDWDVVEGRREGAVRAGIAERIRRFRRRKGEHAETDLDADTATALANMRERTGVKELSEVGGDIVIGRHTWKEYVRGVHEGWLGSIDLPKEEPLVSPALPAIEEAPKAQSSMILDTSYPITPDNSVSLADDASPTSPQTTSESTEKPKEEPKEAHKKPPFAPPHNTTSSYPISKLPPSIPAELSPSSPIIFPHILGFLKTPIRMYRFLNRRHLADEVGRQAAAAVLAAHRPYREAGSTTPTELVSGDDSKSDPPLTQWEQQDVLAREEAEWTKSARVRKDDDGERVWLDDMVIDPRIGQRMRRFELASGDEERARAIWKGAKGIPGRRLGDGGGLERESE